MMELDVERVKAAFQRYSGGAGGEGDEERSELCDALCGECADRVWEQRRAGLSGERLGTFLPALENLAAADAFYQLVLVEEALTPESLSTSEVKLQQGERSRKACLLAEEKRRAAAPALRESEFYFGRVRGDGL